MRIADLEAGGEADVNALRAITEHHREQGLRYGAASDLRLATAITNIAMARAETGVIRAMLQNDNGIHNRVLGTRTAGPEGAALLAEAVVAHRAALEVRTREAHPVDWAMTQNNLGNALQDQGSRTEGLEGAALLGAAVAAYRAAHEVYTRADHPVDWAQTRYNLAILELERFKHDSTQDPNAHLQAALDHVTAALEIYDPQHTSYDHAKAARLRNIITSRLATLAEN